MFRLYRITCQANGKKYIGLTSGTVAARFRHHRKDARDGKGWLLHTAMRKHGEAAFTVEEIAQAATRDEAAQMEQRLIAEEGTRSPAGYNMTDGGDGARGYRHTEEWKAELARRGKGRKCSPEQIQNMRERMLGWVPTEETREKMRANSIGRKHSPETIAKMRESARKRWQEKPIEVTPEWQQRMRTLRSGQTNSPEHNDAIRQALLGRTVPDESRQRMQKAAQLREAKKREKSPLGPGPTQA